MCQHNKKDKKILSLQVLLRYIFDKIIAFHKVQI